MYEAKTISDTSVWENHLKNLTSDFIHAYEALCQDPLRFLTDSANITRFQRRGLTNCVPNFKPLPPGEVMKLASMSYTLGIPLSPVGLVTHTSGELNTMRLAINGGFKILEIGGEYARSTKFKKGPLSRVGLWFTHTPGAGDFTDYEFARQSDEIDQTYTDKKIAKNNIALPAPKIPKKSFPPTNQQEVQTLEEYNTHEGFHGAHLPLTNNLADLPEFDGGLMSELLAFRTSLILGTRTDDDIFGAFLDTYFGELEDDELDQIEMALDVVTQSIEPDYQSFITWRGIGARSIKEFLEPSVELEGFARHMSRFSNEVAIPHLVDQII